MALFSVVWVTSDRRIFAVTVVPEDGRWSARCADPAVASCGDDPGEALSNIVDAVDVYLNTAEASS